jgi:hypothetical protein
MDKETIAVWFSNGAASAVAAKITVERYGETHNVLVVNNPIKEEHPDNLRFKEDVSKWIGKPIIEATCKEYPSHSIVDVFNKRNYVSGPDGAPCTMLLKKQARYEFELSNKIHWHVLGFTFEEISRNERFIKFERENVIPVLIQDKLTKLDCFNIIKEAAIELPYIYKLGYPNANCIGCVKSSSPTYWNLVRETFPAVFAGRAEQSKRIGAKLVKVHCKHLPWTEKVNGLYRDKGTYEQLSTVTTDGKINHTIRVHLDDLPDGLKTGKIKSYECGIFCDTK